MYKHYLEIFICIRRTIQFKWSLFHYNNGVLLTPIDLHKITNGTNSAFRCDILVHALMKIGQKLDWHLGVRPHPRSSLLSLPPLAESQSSASESAASKVGHSRKGKAPSNQAGMPKVSTKVKLKTI